jgi:hypothetical protein
MVMENKKKWTLKDDVLNTDPTINDMIDAISVLEILQSKYPNDETIESTIEILREEICNCFGGSIYKE